MSLLAMVDARLGLEEEAVQAGRSAVELLPLSVDAYSGHRGILDLARVHAILGQEEEALALLEEWLDYGPYYTNLLRLYPAFRSLHDDPRFQELLRRVERTQEPR